MPNRHRQAETPRSRATGIYKQHSVAVCDQRFVRMAGDDDLKSRGSRIDVDLVQVMEDVNSDAGKFQCQPRRELLPPGVFVIISAYHSHRRDLAQCFDHLRATHVAGMDDVFHAG